MFCFSFERFFVSKKISPFFSSQNSRNIERSRVVVGGASLNKNNNDESPSQEIVLAPPPEFSDAVCTNAKCLSTNPGTAANMTGRSVRIVGAVPKLSRLQSH